jgi:hypothetical protein
MAPAVPGVTDRPGVPISTGEPTYEGWQHAQLGGEAAGSNDGLIWHDAEALVLEVVSAPPARSVPDRQEGEEGAGLIGEVGPLVSSRC